MQVLSSRLTLWLLWLSNVIIIKCIGKTTAFVVLWSLESCTFTLLLCFKNNHWTLNAPRRTAPDVYFAPQVSLVDRILEPNVLALWFSHIKTVDDSYKNDCKRIYYTNDSDNSWKEKIIMSVVTKVSLLKTILKSIEPPLGAHPTPAHLLVAINIMN